MENLDPIAIQRSEVWLFGSLDLLPTFLAGRKIVMWSEQNIPTSVLVRVYVLGPLEVWKRETSGTWKRVEKGEWGKGKPARSVFKRLLAASGRRLSRSKI